MLLLIALLLAAPPSNLQAQGEAGLRAIRSESLSGHIRFLADDLLEGRGTGSSGHAIAAHYLAFQLQALGLQAAGEGGTWFQAVPFIGMTVVPEKCALELDGVALKYPDEVLFFPRAGASSDDASGELVFAGYGVSAPLYGYSDLPEDLRGKIAVVLYGAPHSDREDFFPTAASAVYSDHLVKTRVLAERGAVGMILVQTPEMDRTSPWPFTQLNFAFERIVWHEGNKAVGGYVLPAAWMPSSGLQRLLAGSGHTAEEVFAAGPKGALKPFPLRMRARLHVTANLREFSSDNVAGVLRGGDRADEYVALSAHLDHLGIGPVIDGDGIYNGAVDNASGVSAIIEIARAFASLPHRPRRSILVLGFTAEEKYLQGSEYFARHPTVPLTSIVADVNLDSMKGLRREPHDIVPIGAEHSTLMAAARAAAKAQSLKISPDPQPNEVFFIRADQYRFVRVGIPSVFPRVGWQDAQGNVDKAKAYDEWWSKNRYHKPTDEWDPKADYESLAKEVGADFLMTLSIASDLERPRWNKGDVFGKLFASPSQAR
jgi:hypothetical protein